MCLGPRGFLGCWTFNLKPGTIPGQLGQIGSLIPYLCSSWTLCFTSTFFSNTPPLPTPYLSPTSGTFSSLSPGASNASTLHVSIARGGVHLEVHPGSQASLCPPGPPHRSGLLPVPSLFIGLCLGNANLKTKQNNYWGGTSSPKK